MDAGPWFWSEGRDDVVLGFTRGAGGVSVGPYGELNLGLHVGDDEERVRANRARVVDALADLAHCDPAAIDPVFMAQVHGTEVRVIDSRSLEASVHVPEHVPEHVPWAEHGVVPVPAQPARPVECDAVVTTEPGVALFVLVADCTPVLLVDREASVVAAVHAGRAGMLGGIVPRTVETMRALGARGVVAVVGPSVCGRCYEVPLRMRDQAAATEPVAAAVTWTGTAAIDVAAGVVEQLRRDEVPVRWVPGCSREDHALFSHRRDGRTGRFAGVVMLTPRGRGPAPHARGASR